MSNDSLPGMQGDPHLKAVLAARLSCPEGSGHSSSSNGGPTPEGPSAEERRARTKRAHKDCSAPPAPIRLDVSDSGSSQLFFSASQSSYEVGTLPFTQLFSSATQSMTEEPVQYSLQYLPSARPWTQYCLAINGERLKLCRLA